MPALSPVSIAQPIAAGVLAAAVGFASSVAIVLAGFIAAGASPHEAASGLFAISIGMGLLGIVLSVRSRIPITVAWSTPGAALLISSGAPAGGYAFVTGAFLVAGALIVVAGVLRPFGRAVAAIHLSLASAMLAGVILELCFAPVRAVAEFPLVALPIIIVWAIALRFARRYAVLIAVAVTATMVAATTPIPHDAIANIIPAPTFIVPQFSFAALIGLAVPLFLVTMASQNVPGLAVMAVNGYRPDPGPIFVWTGAGSLITALLGGHTLCLAAITAALCAGPEADPDPSRRWIASAACGVAYVLLALTAGFATAFVAASPPLLIEAVAGLALLGSLGNALSAAMAKEDERLPALATFVTTASGVAFFGIGAAFWGLLAGGALMAALKLTTQWRRPSL